MVTSPLRGTRRPRKAGTGKDLSADVAEGLLLLLFGEALDRTSRRHAAKVLRLHRLAAVMLLLNRV